MKRESNLTKNKKSISVMGGILLLVFAFLFLRNGLSAEKMEIHLWKEGGVTYYNLLPGGDEERTEEVKYNPKTAETNLGEVSKKLSKQKAALRVSLHPDRRNRKYTDPDGEFSEFEMENIAMHLKGSLPKGSTLEVDRAIRISKTIKVEVPATEEVGTAFGFPLDRIAFDFLKDTGNRKLTTKEVEEVNAAFERVLNHPTKEEESFVNPVCHFFNSYYDAPQEMNLNQFIQNLPAEQLMPGKKADESEYAKLREGNDFLIHPELKDAITPIRRIKREFLNDMLARYTGIVSEDCVNREGIMYLGKPYDCYYSYSGDFGVGAFECVGGEINGDELKLYSEYAVLTLMKAEDRYLIVSHQRKGS